MIPDTNGKPESRESEAEQLAKLLEIELALKKSEWAGATERYRKLRTASFLFLALIIMGTLVAFFIFVLPLLQTERGARSAPTQSASP
jgi:hypothetical protein